MRATSERQAHGYRLCRKCGLRRPWPSQFAVTRNGTVSGVTCNRCGGRRGCLKCHQLRRVPDEIRPMGSVCNSCKHKRRLAYDKARYHEKRDEIIARVKDWIARNPEKHSEYMRTTYERMRSDPDRWRDYLVKQRIDSRLQGRVRNAQEPKVSAVDGYASAPSKLGPMLPAAPIATWLRSEFPGYALTELAERLGEDDRLLWRLLHEQDEVSLHVADRIFVKADCPHLLALLYPIEEAAA